MDPLVIESKTNTSGGTVLLGVFFILFGILLEIGIAVLCMMEGVRTGYVLAMLLFPLMILTGVYCIHLRKYPFILLADEKGIHHFVYPGRWHIGFNRQEVVLPWKDMTAISSYREPVEEDIEYDAIQIDKTDDAPVMVYLQAAKNLPDLDSIVASMNKMRIFYCKKA